MSGLLVGLRLIFACLAGRLPPAAMNSLPSSVVIINDDFCFRFLPLARLCLRRDLPWKKNNSPYENENKDNNKNDNYIIFSSSKSMFCFMI